MKQKSKIASFEILILIIGTIAFSHLASASINNPISQTYESDLYQGRYEVDYNQFFSGW